VRENRNPGAGVGRQHADVFHEDQALGRIVRIVPADERVAGAEHEREAPAPVEQAAHAGVEHALDEHVDGFAVTTEAGLEHREAGLHAEDEEGAEQHPAGVDGIDQIAGDDRFVGIGRRGLGEHRVAGQGAEQQRAADDQREQGDQAKRSAREQQRSVFPPFVVAQPLPQPGELLVERQTSRFTRPADSTATRKSFQHDTSLVWAYGDAWFKNRRQSEDTLALASAETRRWSVDGGRQRANG